MKKVILFLALAGLFVSCEKKYSETVTYKVNEPVYMSSEAFLKSVVVTNDGQHAVSGSGKICFHNGYLYISEPGKGIHIIDNRSPQNPHAIGFIELLGNADLAIRNNLLYADAYSNLVWFDISNPAKPQIIDMLENVFQNVLPPIDNEFGIDYNAVYSEEAKAKGIIVDWKLTEKTMDAEGHANRYCCGGMEFAVNDAAKAPSVAGGGGNGINGSMSRFGLYQDYLYVVLNNQLSAFDVSQGEPTKAMENMYIGWNVETIFSYKENLFFSTPSGLLIYSVANPLAPKYCSSITHAYGCDPVVVENDIAYVTIHSGNVCGQNTNELIIIDVKDVYKPRELASYAMTKPKGLGIDNSTLFVCDDGLKIFNAKNPQTIIANQLAHYTGMDGYDVIPFNNVLMMIAEDGLHQYDYSDLGNIRELGTLRFVKK
ncbi:MAG: hypothetical protein FWC39_06580 [Bacteroidetes bacterium]|nr:hypothetical protein [Bacteroidota bacterium]